MRLKSVHITEFQSIMDSSRFDVDDITCLVGKNEAGKTALLKALYRLNPITGEGTFNVTDDYPRVDVSDYEDDIEAGRRDHSTVISAIYVLHQEEIAAVENVFGPDCCLDKDPSVTLSKGYENKRRYSNFRIGTKKALKYLIEKAGLPSQLTSDLLQKTTAIAMLEHLKAAEQTAAVETLTPYPPGLRRT